MYTIKLLTEAELEIQEACEWYDEQQPGLAKRFLDEIDVYLSQISKDSLHFPIRFSERYRFATLKVFPYLIVYRIDEAQNLIYIISVFHTSRNTHNL